MNNIAKVDKQPQDRYLRLAELMASFSLAIDLGMGQPLDWVMRTCLLGTHLSQLLGLSSDECRQVYYLSLLKHIGCTSASSWQAELFGNELGMGQVLTVDTKNPVEVFPTIVKMAGQGQPLLARARYLRRALAAGPGAKDELSLIQCEVAGNLAGRLGFAQEMLYTLGQLFERWDGQGQPYQLKGDAIALPVRVIHLAYDAATLQLQADSETAINVVKKRSGRLYDPAIADVFLQAAPDLFAQLEVESTWDAILAAEFELATWLSEEQFEDALLAIADFTDLKSPYLVGHSRGVATLAEEAARQCGLPDADATSLRRAGLLHDLGRVGVSSSIWNKPGKLTESEWERVRLHPYLTERILARSQVMAPLVDLAILHHERLDGSGYHRRLPAPMLPLTARILAAADAYHAMTEPRPHRPALSPDEAAAELRQDVKAGQFDAAAADAVLSATGHQVQRPRHATPGGLSKREIEVLRLMARGLSNPEIGEELVISKKTVGHHVQHIYNKIDVSTRAGATLFAMQHNLLSTLDRSS
ncbi:MAG: HD domain-containing phosphohydrolase [Chloroflexota bacterium]